MSVMARWAVMLITCEERERPRRLHQGGGRHRQRQREQQVGGGVSPITLSITNLGAAGSTSPERRRVTMG